jgi:hypothetical protein
MADIEEIEAEFEQEDGKILKAAIRVLPKHHTVENGVVVKTTVDRVLGFAGRPVPDGKYTMRFPFHGKVEVHKQRVEGGKLLGGW